MVTHHAEEHPAFGVTAVSRYSTGLSITTE